ncbi:enoyl-CoA hydratase-related protein [Lentibacillus cibarius]|uniref:enoyl-CoA hydratase-related protein n=1 Tax=Lentibacillus cibarius TaxID=2583219 RepID=UPI0018F8B964|nr:enoyl-CoA hydratase-related protein [Lentibacillus cibarius]
MQDTYIKTEKHGAVYQITIDRPKANAINVDMSLELYHAFMDFHQDNAMKAAVITGSGEKFFSAGWDLKSEEPIDADYGPGGFAGLTEVYHVQKPIIAAVNGMAVGGGFELALACDIIVAADHAEFFLPEAMVGIIPDAGGVLRLPKYLPQKLAMDMMLTGRRLSAEEGLHHGLLKNVTSFDELLPEAYRIAEQLTKSAPLSIAAIKEVVQYTAHLPVEEGFALMRSGELETYQKMLQSEDAIEGSKAFSVAS